MTAAPPPARQYVWPSRALAVVAAVCELLAALTAAGSQIAGAPMWAWGFGGLAAWFLAAAVP